MASFNGTIYSKSLGMDTNLNIITPRGKLTDTNGNIPRVAYLLHGLSDNAAAWLENANLRELSDKYNVAFVMPEVQRSFYTDMAFGLDYYTFISEELPEMVSSIFKFSEKREDTAIMGLSMGGYGAFKIGMRNPDKFSKIGGFSTVCDVKAAMKDTDNVTFTEREKISVLGNEQILSDNDNLYHISEEFSKSGFKTEIYFSCGENDFLLSMNKDYAEHLKSLEIPYSFEMWEGIHNWKFWRESLDKALEKFFG